MSRRYHTLLFDMDNTILDFSAAEHNAIVQTLQTFGAEPASEVVTLYSAINDVLWKRLEKGAVSRDEVIHGRFEVLCHALGLPCDGAQWQTVYQSHLCQGHTYLPGARELLERLQGQYAIYLLTNGLAATQHPRLRDSGLENLVQGTFISEEIGWQKPDRRFYEVCFSRIPDFDPAAALIIGDSLTSDIAGGNNAGIDTCWYNPAGAVNDRGVHVDYEIRALSDLEEILTQPVPHG